MGWGWLEFHKNRKGEIPDPQQGTNTWLLHACILRAWWTRHLPGEFTYSPLLTSKCWFSSVRNLIFSSFLSFWFQPVEHPVLSVLRSILSNLRSYTPWILRTSRGILLMIETEPMVVIDKNAFYILVYHSEMSLLCAPLAPSLSLYLPYCVVIICRLH